MSDLVVAPDAGSLAAEAAQRFAAAAVLGISERDRFVVALSGGSTPEPIYERLASKRFGSRVDWPRVHVLWGDERSVPPEHPDSNYRMASEALLDHVPIPRENVHRIRGELEPQEAATLYRRELARVLGEGGRIDLVVLGLGTDGHTASLFPGSTALEEHDLDVVAVYVERLGVWRVTLTLPAINAARQAVFLVAGAGKAEVLARVRSGEALPAGLVRPRDGKLTWLVDRDAAAGLGKDWAL
ncbi:MAG: 6-phosphogluconolactonase [Anaerolineae bacterium]